MLLVEKLKLHLGPIVLSVVLVVLATLWQFWESHQAGRWVSGSSLSGLVVGSVAALIILFEVLLWPRKKLRRFKLFPTRYWMSAHLWLGLATGPLAWIHSGYRFGGNFSSLLMWLLLFVIASGVYGWIMQVLVPRWMLRNLPQETILNQIEDVSVLTALESRQVLTVALGPKPPNLKKLANLDDLATKIQSPRVSRDASGERKAIIVGAVQRRELGRTLSAEEMQFELREEDSREIWRQYAAVIEPFLLRSDQTANALYSDGMTLGTAKFTQQQWNDWFDVLKGSCSVQASSLIDKLKLSVEKRLQFDSQRRAHRWLHGWVILHASVSIMLCILLLAHIVLALRYM